MTTCRTLTVVCAVVQRVRLIPNPEPAEQGARSLNTRRAFKSEDDPRSEVRISIINNLRQDAAATQRQPIPLQI